MCEEIKTVKSIKLNKLFRNDLIFRRKSFFRVGERNYRFISNTFCSLLLMKPSAW